jgi:CubicO group peptidase (beta-lactamase class C family)
MRYAHARLALCAGALPFAQAAAQAAQPIDSFVDSLFRARFAAGAPGAAVAVFRADALLHLGTYGLADVAEKRPVTATTKFMLASVSKPFTAMAVQALVRDGKLGLHERLVDLIPELRHSDSTITVRHLLTHSSGLADVYSFIEWPKFKYLDNAGVLDTTRAHATPKFAPGSKYEYSNTNYVLLSLIVQRRSGMVLGDFLAERVFRPLGMSAVVYDDTTRHVDERAVGYTSDAGKWLLSDNGALELPNGRVLRFAFVQTGQGGVFSSITDMATWGRALLDPAWFSARDRAALWSPQLPAVGQSGIDSVQSVAQGWFVSRRHGRTVIWHDGNRGGAKAIIALVPDLRFGVVVLSNREDTNPVELASLILDALAKK